MANRLSYEDTVYKNWYITTRVSNMQWNAFCPKCGKESTIWTNTIRKCHTPYCKHCGESSLKHGHLIGRKPTKTYKSWEGMHRRVNRKPSEKGYEYYGGKGVTVCDRWRLFVNFLADMGVRPAKTMLDRINGDGNYEPSNCRWATQQESDRNRCNSRFVMYRGEKMLMTEAARLGGINVSTLMRQLDRQKSDTACDVSQLPCALGIRDKPMEQKRSVAVQPT